MKGKTPEGAYRRTLGEAAGHIYHAVFHSEAQ